MSEIETITMTMREVDRLKVVEAVVDGRLMTWRAAERLGMSRRQVERLANRYRAEGDAGLISKRRHRPSNHQLPDDTICRALASRVRGAANGSLMRFSCTRKSSRLTIRHFHSRSGRISASHC
ncbi:MULTISPECIES: helix-turn-helix domain-containing protein [unclassified Caballeronia]|uniref:helix-turn-helix domain-containing protein n=1 Tax=unclassified Caballeronia TaxID=2646786 RepID=UPI0032F00749